MSHPEDEPPLSTPEEAGHEALETFSEIAWLFRQCWADAVNLLAVESRLALRGLIFIVVLIFCLAGLLAGGWLLLVLALVYGAASLNVPAWAIAVGALLLHLLAFVGVTRQMLALGRLLSFPRSRQAAAELLSRQAPQSD